MPKFTIRVETKDHEGFLSDELDVESSALSDMMEQLKGGTMEVLTITRAGEVIIFRKGVLDTSVIFVRVKQ